MCTAVSAYALMRNRTKGERLSFSEDPTGTDRAGHDLEFCLLFHPWRTFAHSSPGQCKPECRPTGEWVVYSTRRRTHVTVSLWQTGDDLDFWNDRLDGQPAEINRTSDAEEE